MKIAVCLIISIIGIALCSVLSYKLGKKSREKEIAAIRRSNYRNNELYKFMVKWFFLKQVHESVTDYFEEKQYSKIAIYGMHYLGERLLKELEESNVQVVYGIDKNATNLNSQIPIKKPEEDLPPVDVIVVTAILDIDVIKKMLQEKVTCPIVSLEEVVNFI